MNEALHIRYLPYKEIDKVKWDRCIETAPNGLIYAYSWYLDQMAPRWDALVMDDYAMVLPLTWNRKYGVTYLYQPFLTAQLGLFGKNITAAILESFLLAIPARFRYWDIYLNHGNVFGLQQFHPYRRRNFVLDLDKPYEVLYAGYRENIQRNIRKALQMGCTPARDFDVERMLELAVAQMRNYTKESADNIERFRRLYAFLRSRQEAVTYGILSARKELIASCIFLFSHRRAYYILVGNHPDGRTIGASHALIDTFIRDHAGRDMILDFEGSDIRNLAFFYSSFGAAEEGYAAVKQNKLPFYLRWLK